MAGSPFEIRTLTDQIAPIPCPSAPTASQDRCSSDVQTDMAFCGPVTRNITIRAFLEVPIRFFDVQHIWNCPGSALSFCEGGYTIGIGTVLPQSATNFNPLGGQTCSVTAPVITDAVYIPIGINILLTNSTITTVDFSPADPLGIVEVYIAPDIVVLPNE